MAEARVADLRWPADVVEQWLYDHADRAAFQRDYANVDLMALAWTLEPVPAVGFVTMPTGATGAGAIEEYAANPTHWISVRSSGVHQGVALMWDIHGTWKRWPLLLDQSILDPTRHGLQVVEGRTRVGVLRGRLQGRAHVAEQHLAWVGRRPHRNVRKRRSASPLAPAAILADGI